MSEKSYSEWFKGTVRDPLWLVQTGSIILVVALSLAGAPSAVVGALWIVYGLSHVASAVRGKEFGSGKPMGTAERVVISAAGAIIVLLSVLFIFTM